MDGLPARWRGRRGEETARTTIRGCDQLLHPRRGDDRVRRAAYAGSTTTGRQPSCTLAAMEARFRCRWPAVAGIALAVVVTAFLALFSAFHSGPGAGLLLVAGAGLSLAIRGWRPLVAYGASLGFTAAYLVVGNPAGPIFVAPFIGLLTLIPGASPRVWGPAALGGAAILAVAHGLGNGWSLSIWVFAAVWVVLATGIGGALQVRRRFMAEVRARAQWAERSREEQARRRMAEERLRIARELHDIVGHSLAVITLQAGVAEHLLERRPEEVRKAVTAIRQVSKQALDDLRFELALLRGEGSETAARAPTPGLAALPALVASVREAGLRVDLDLGVAPGSVPEIVSAAAYRIVQESLTNVARHAGAGASATVRLRAAGSALEIEVADDGPGAADAAPEGSGLIGMRERAVALGGEFSAANRAEGGFAVRVRLPWKQP